MRVRRDGYCDVDPRLAAALSSQLLPSADAAGGRGYRAATWVVNCTTVCGDVIVAYPFGLTAGCYLPRFFPVCSIFPESIYTTDMQEQIFLCVRLFPCESFHNRQGNINFPVGC